METEKRQPLSVGIRADIADAISQQARTQGRTKSGIVERHVRSFLEAGGLRPIPGAGRILRGKSPLEYKVRRYMVDPTLIKEVARVEQMGYSRAYIVEEALRVGLGVRE